jgi:hypothetical protein
MCATVLRVIMRLARFVSFRDLPSWGQTSRLQAKYGFSVD